MMAPIRVASFVVLATLSGCTGSGGMPDGTLPDRALDADATADVGVDAPVCNGPAPADLAVVGTTMPNGSSIIDDNSGADPDPADALQPNGATCGFQVAYELTYLYTLRTNAALRVSTDNSGSDESVDTVLFVTTAPCRLPPDVLGCNDDDPYAPSSPHDPLSLVVTSVLPAGTQVLIAVGGFYPADGTGIVPNPGGIAGTYQLTVAEVTPLAVGAVCDPSGDGNVCAATAACVADDLEATAFHCQPVGGAAGAPCLAGGSCSGTLTCDTSANVCYDGVTAGEMCDRMGTEHARCVSGTTCVSSVRGGAHGVCVTNGAGYNAACDASGACTGALLVCEARPGTTSVCVTSVGPGSVCDTVSTECTSGESCLAPGSGAAIGTCVPAGTAPGTACRSDFPECDDGLACITSGVTRACRTLGVNDGDPCGVFGACSFDAHCTTLDPSHPTQGVCASPGAISGPCNASGAACAPGLTCTDPVNRYDGFCVHVSSATGPCDTPGRQTACIAGLSCVRQGTAGVMGECFATGTAAGTACRTSGAACDAGLACSGGICRSPSTTGDCDPHYATLACPTGQVCIASGFEQGSCGVPASAASATDGVPATGSPVATPGAVQGALGAYEVACFGVSISAGSALYAQANAPDGTCGIALQVDVYAPDATFIGGDASSGAYGCPRVDGTDLVDFPWAAGLATGVYTVCVWQHSDRSPVPGYVLSIATH